MADGKTEEEAVQEVGSIDDIVKQVLSETPLVSLFKEKIKPKRSLNAWEIILLVLGFPLWFPLLITFFCLALTAYILLWVGVIVVYSIEFAFIAVGLAGIVCFFAYLFSGRFNLVCLGLGLIGAGLALLLYIGCVEITKATLKFSKFIILKVKSWFVRGE